jgi:acyl dehydratase
MAVEQFPIEAGHVMMFARSVGDPNPIYADEAYAAESELGSPIAPPTFVQASAQFDPDYPLRPKVGQPWFGSGKQPSGLQRSDAAGDGASQGQGGDESGERRRGGGGTALHAEQHYEYHRPLRVGEVLTVTTKPGEQWEKEGRRAGRLLFSEQIAEYRDEDGQLVVTARGVAVRTQRPVDE